MQAPEEAPEEVAQPAEDTGQETAEPAEETGQEATAAGELDPAPAQAGQSVAPATEAGVAAFSHASEPDFADRRFPLPPPPPPKRRPPSPAGSSESEEVEVPASARKALFNPLKGKLSVGVFCNVEVEDISSIVDDVLFSPWLVTVFPRVWPEFVEAFFADMHQDDRDRLVWRHNSCKTVLAVAKVNRAGWLPHHDDFIVTGGRWELGSLFCFSVSHRKPQLGCAAHALACLQLRS